MRRDYSRTAEAVALARAVERAQPPARRIIDDPYAAAFLQNPYYRLVAGSPPHARLLLAFLDRWAPGVQEFVTIRARLVDDQARALAGRRLDQIVLLGAGFDSFAWRAGGALGGVTVFEVDHPATQAVKRAGAARLGVPANLRFVAVDFESDDLGARLAGANLAPDRRTLVVWVGVSYYLTAGAVTRALAQLAGLGGAGTRLVFDYLLADVVAGTSADRWALDSARWVAALGEPLLFGLRPGDVESFLTAFGFRLLADYDPAELHARYAPHRREPIGYARLVVCEKGNHGGHAEHGKDHVSGSGPNFPCSG